MARKSYKMEQESAQRIPIIGVGAEQDHIEQPVSSGDTIALDSDATMMDGQKDDDGHRTIRENENTGKSYTFLVQRSAISDFPSK